jgi:hypothetical protein
MPVKLLLIPEPQIWLLAVDCDGQTFKRQFHDCWKRIPLDSKQTICDFWRAVGPHWPVIELSNLWEDSKWKHAEVNNMGREVFFSATSFRSFPNTVAIWNIAHELAHIYQKACGRKPGGECEEENERDADRIAVEWGFNPRPNRLFGHLESTHSFEYACNFLKTMDY